MTIHSRFVRETSGNVAMSFALAILPMVGLAGAALDYSQASAAREQLQAAVDAAALRAARMPVGTEQARKDNVYASFPGATRGGTTSTAAPAPATDGSLAAGAASTPPYTVDAGVTGQTVSVTATRMVKTSVMGIFGQSYTYIPVTAQATALRTIQGPPICVLAISKRDPAASGAITVAGNAAVIAKDCALYSNSSAADAIRVQGSATVQAAGYCAVGGIISPTTLTPAPTQGCDRQADPFEGKFPVPVTTGCDFNNVRVGSNKTETLSPGIYCGGIDVKGTAIFRSGLYVVKNGALDINAGGAASGTGVTFYLTGTNAGFDFNGSGALTMAAPTDGTYSGMLVIQDAASNAGRTNKINGNSNTSIMGALYAPSQFIEVTGNGTFGQSNPFMPMVADRVSFSGSSVTQSEVTAMKTVAPIPRFTVEARLLN
jgi:Flp pilus assembly protein TadG